jgi:hypothetical protein
MNDEGAPISASSHSQLFTLRVWYGEQSPGARELRVQIRHVLTGDTHYFRDWAAIHTYIATKFDASDRAPQE